MLRSVIGMRPVNVVLAFNSSSGISSRSLARHSSANELVTVSMPVKSRTTLDLVHNNSLPEAEKFPLQVDESELLPICGTPAGCSFHRTVLCRRCPLQESTDVIMYLRS